MPTHEEIVIEKIEVELRHNREMQKIISDDNKKEYYKGIVDGLLFALDAIKGGRR